MRLKTLRDGKYLLVKLGQGDWRYLKTLIKHEKAKIVKKTDKYLSEITSLHIKSVFVMIAAMILQKRRKLSKKFAQNIFRQLDDSFSHFDKATNKYFHVLGRLMFKSKKK